MALKYGILEEVVHKFGWRVVVALNLVNNNLYLLVYLCLRISAVEHNVGKQVHSAVYVALQYGSMIYRLLLVGKGV